MNRPRRNWPWVCCVAALGALLSCASPGGEPSSPGIARNLLLITLDTTRADHLSLYGGNAQVPAIEHLARDGARFDRAFAPAPLTLPSHVSLFTGLYPAAHGVHNNGTYVLKDEALTLAEVLEDAGFQTAAVIGSLVLDARYGLNQGFDLYDHRIGGGDDESPTPFVERSAEEVADRGLEWLAGRGGERWCLWLHFFDPHWEYHPPEPYRGRYADSPYDGEIAYADEHIGRVVDFLSQKGWLDDTLVVVTADHGESLDEHGESTHGLFVYDATMHVPLVMRHPGRLGKGRTVGTLASLVDVAPTVLDVLGLGAKGPPTDGRSLVPAVMGEPGPPREVLLETRAPQLDYGWSPLAAVRDERWKYVQAPRPELYDLVADPGELHDLATEMPERVSEYAARLEALEETVTDAESPAVPLEPDAETRRKLESLGYLSGAGAAEGAATGADPKDKVQEMEAIQKAIGLVFHERYGEAIPALEALVRTNPASPTLCRHLGSSLLQVGRLDDAIAELERCVDLDPDDFGLRTILGSAELRAGNADGAEQSFRAALRLNPHVAEALHNLGLLAQSAGRASDAVRYYERALAEDPTLVRSAVNLGVLYEAAGRFDDAIQMYRRVTQLDPKNVRAFFSAAFLLVQTGRLREALEVLDRARQADPLSPLPHVYRAQVYRELGELDAAVRELQAALKLDPASEEARQALAALERERDGG